MSAPDPLDEFAQIAELFRPLTRGAPEALDLRDDAALIAHRPGQDLVVTKDAIVEGVHFLPHDPPDLVARKLLRVNLSDLAAKGARPWGYLLAVGWPASLGRAARAAFAAGLKEDGETFDLRLLGGDTVATAGPWFASVTALGWTPSGGMVRRAGARPGDVVLVSGVIGDGWLGLAAARGEIADPHGALAARYRLPQPRLGLRQALRDHASAAADVSDGLIADAGHIAEASGVAIGLDLDALPLSPDAQAWLAAQPSQSEALAALAAGGDDYEIVCTAPAARVAAFQAAAEAAGLALTAIGRVTAGEGTQVAWRGEPVTMARGGYRHT